MTTTFGSVCSGIEAASVAWHPLGWRAAWLAEIEPFPSAVLAHHYPGVPNLGDMTRLPERIASGEVEAPDMFCGGTPCQAFSVAGLRRSLDDARGNLSLTFCEIANAIDDVRRARGDHECVVFWENVPGVLSTSDNAFGCFLGALAGADSAIVPRGRWTNAGVVAGPKRTVAWRTLDAQYFGVAQRRRRVFVVASARAGFDPAAVLFEWDGLRRDSAPSREAGQATAGSAGAGAQGRSGIVGSLACNTGPNGHDAGNFACNQAVDAGHVLPVITMAHGQGGAEIGFDRGPTLTCNHEAPIAAYTTKLHNTQSNQAGKVYAEYSTSLDANSPPPAVFQPVEPMFLHANKGRPAGRQSAHTEMVSIKPLVETLTTDGHSQSAVAVPVQPYTLAIRGRGDSHNLEYRQDGTGRGTPLVPAPIPFDPKQIAHPANFSRPKPGDPCHPLRAVANCEPAIAFHPTQDPISSTDVCHSLGANDNATAAVAFTQNQRDEVRTLEVAGALAAEPGMKQQTYLAQTIGWDEELNASTEQSGTLLRGGQGGRRDGVMTSCMQVRRLTPVECERLQGFPDDYTAIPWRGKPADQCPDGPRYKALGNSWAVPVVRWIGSRIDAALRGVAA